MAEMEICNQQRENGLHYFSIVAIANYHKLSGLKTTQIHYLTVLEVRSPTWVLLGYNPGVGLYSLVEIYMPFAAS